MRSVPPALALLLVLAPSAGLATSSPLLSYRILLQVPEQLVVSDVQVAGPLADSLTSVAGVAMATVNVDYGEIALSAGSEAEGPASPVLAHTANPDAQFDDEITIEPPTPGELFTSGTFVSRFELSGTGGATAGGAETSNTRARYSLFGRINTCTLGCEFRRQGEWFDFGTTDISGFDGDPVASFETGPIGFAFGLPFPIIVSLSLETQATADTEAALAESFANFGGTLRWSIVEVRDSFGDLVGVPGVSAVSGAVYVPEPGGAGPVVVALAMLGSLAARRRAARRAAACY
jgi:hypothetical protein